MHSVADSPAQPRFAMTIDSAAQGWGLVMQSGVRVPCAVGISLQALLREEFGLAPEQIKRIDAMLLDGKPVDAPEAAIVPHGARLALAAGLPGIAGLAMKSGSAVRGLRPGITFREGGAEAPAPGGPGEVELALFSLALGMLAGHFLARGVILRVGQLARYAGRYGDAPCLLGGQKRTVTGALEELALLPEDTPVLLVARLTKTDPKGGPQGRVR